MSLTFTSACCLHIAVTTCKDVITVRHKQFHEHFATLLHLFVCMYIYININIYIHIDTNFVLADLNVLIDSIFQKFYRLQVIFADWLFYPSLLSSVMESTF